MSAGPAIAGIRAPEVLPRRVVALGGGTGLPAVLRGLKTILGRRDVDALTAVVTMSDDGGSSGRLRQSMGLPPPGDVRNCLVALSEEEDALAAIFQHRYGESPELRGHSVGNLILAALAEQTGSFLNAVEVSSRVLRTAGRILPATLDDIRLVAELVDGGRVIGETAIATCGRRIGRISLLPRDARPAPGVIKAIHEAELVVLGPGSLFTSLVPHLAVRGVAQALRETRAVVMLVANLVSGKGEVVGLDPGDELAVIEDHAGGKIVQGVLVHEGPIDEDILARYRAEGAAPFRWRDGSDRRVHVERRNLLAPGPKLRHDPSATAAGLLAAWRRLRPSSMARER